MIRYGIPLKNRRELLRELFFCGTGWVSPFNRLHFADNVFHETEKRRVSGSLLGVVPFSDEGHAPIEKLIGSEMDGRLFTNLSALTPETPLTPTERFFVRTRASKLMDTSKTWTIRIGGGLEKSSTVSVDALVRRSRRMGDCLMECSGNPRSARFGMLSTAAWDGVPLQEVLNEVPPRIPNPRILVSGFDRYAEESMTSDPGASWIFTPEQAISANAFLATKMNGKPLALDHGAPVRLVVPGWYGCACIKWVNQIDYVSDDAPASSQMLEYASRTMQAGVPSLAREYHAATMEPAAMPTRVEKWRVAGKIIYRLMGIQWGRLSSRPEIEIRFNPDQGFVPVADLRAGSCNYFWRYDWVPTRVGRFTIRLRLKNADMMTSRLNSGYYDRSVEITEI